MCPPDKQVHSPGRGLAHLTSHTRDSPNIRVVSCMTRRAGGVSTTGLTSRFPSLVTGARAGAYEDAIQDLSMRSVPLKSTLTPASSRGPAEASPEPAIFCTCSNE